MSESSPSGISRPLSAITEPGNDADQSVPPTARGVWRVGFLRRCSLLLAWLVVLLGCVVLTGWAAGMPRLTSVLPGNAATSPATALCWTLAGLALISARATTRAGRVLARTLAGVVIVFGITRLVGALFRAELGLDGWLFHDRIVTEKGQLASRMALNSALCLALCGVSLWGLVTRLRFGPFLAQAVALAVILVALLAVVGHAVDAPELYHMNTQHPMPMPTAAALGMLAVALLAARPDEGLMAVVSGDGPGSQMARRLIPPSVVLPVLIVGGLFLASRAGLFSQPTAIGLTILSTILVLMVLIWGNASLIEAAEERRRRADRDLMQSELFYHTLVETLPQNILRKNAEGRFTFANRLCAQTFGVAQTEVIGKCDADLFPRSLAEKYRNDDQRVMDAGESMEMVEEHVTPDGATHFVQVIKTPIFDGRGKPIGIQGIFWDVTDALLTQKRLREQNERLQELAESERRALDELKQTQMRMVETAKLAALGQMVAGVAHEINNPLAFVLNNVVVLERDLRGACEVLLRLRALEPRMRSVAADTCNQLREIWEDADVDYTLANLPGLLARTREGLGRIQRIVKDLRVFARVEDDQFVESEVNAGIESTVHILQGNARVRGVNLHLNLGPLPPLYCQPAKINQVIMNLVSNAIEACGAGASVTILSRAEPNHVVIEVADTGAGIDPAVRERIFDPFFTTKPIGEGTGLGLSISYGIVTEHGGSIEVQSQVGAGARFTVFLPVRPARAARHFPQDTAPEASMLEKAL